MNKIVANPAFAIRYRVSHYGRRQILNVVLPGDFIGFPACFFESALFSVGALTDIQVSAVPMARLLALFELPGRLAATLLWQFACEAAMYAGHLIDVGRRSAVERVAHFLLELLTRLQAIGLAEERSYTMPLTQAVTGEILGLSMEQVNRSLRQLRDDGLVTMAGRRISIKNFDGLAAIADFEKSYVNRFRINEALTRVEANPVIKRPLLTVTGKGPPRPTARARRPTPKKQCTR